MIYTVEGGNKSQRKIVDTAMSYVVQFVNAGNAFVEIHLGTYESHGVMMIGANTFLIEICKNVSNAEIAYTVCHEMKHVEQMSSKRLVYASGKTLWLGEDHSKLDYLDRPWEKEAYKFEKIADCLLTRIAA